MNVALERIAQRRRPPQRADGTRTVVYLRNGGKGDGSSPGSAIGTLAGAFDALDLAKDCTVVICGEFTQSKTFLYTVLYTGSVTFTSVYDGVDYRSTASAVWTPCETRFVCTGTTVFRDLDFYLLGNYYLIVGAYQSVTVGANVTVRSMRRGFDGSGIANGFSILGGYQQGVRITKKGKFPTDVELPSRITVQSGGNIVVRAGNRGFTPQNRL